MQVVRIHAAIMVVNADVAELAVAAVNAAAVEGAGFDGADGVVTG